MTASVARQSVYLDVPCNNAWPQLPGRACVSADARGGTYTSTIPATDRPRRDSDRAAYWRTLTPLGRR